MPVSIGKIKQQQQDTKGWLVGQFFPEDSQFKDDNVEIYCKTFSKGNTSDKLHFHPKGREYLFVISGKAKIRIGEEDIILTEGDYVAIPNNTADKLVEILEDLIIFGVRYPSILDNKVLIEE